MIRVYIIGVIAWLLMSCSGFLKDYSQDLGYVNSYEDLDELLVGSAYLNSDFSSLTGYTHYIHLISDEMRENIEEAFSVESYTPREKYFGYYTWQKRVDLGFDNLEQLNEDSDWNRFYEHINVANMIIKEVEELSSDNAAEQREIDRVRGEAYFLRGAYYFWLVNLYGKPYTAATAATDLGVPLKLTEYIEDKKYSRNSVQEVYDQVLADLDEAEKALENTTRKSVFRADITATYLLKSRIYLYMRNWDLAREYAEKCLAKNDQLVDLNGFDAGSTYFINKNSVELIFSSGNNWICQNTSMRQKGMSASQDLIDLYDKNSNDLRKDIFLNTSYSYGSPYLPQRKFDTNNGGDVSDVCVYRTAEAYLNLAEAYVYLENESAARTALDNLRKKRIRASAYEDTSLSGEELIQEIRDERFRELAFEGHRWYDLRRYTVCDLYPLQKVLQNTYTTYSDNGWMLTLLQTYVYELRPDDPAYCLPIPSEVLEYDELIEDNPRNERTVARTIDYN